MNPNSANQVWSKWDYTVAAVKQPSFAQVKVNCARFGVKAFGTAAQMRVTHTGPAWTISVLAEGAPVWDQDFVAYMHKQWRRFFHTGFGIGSVITGSARLLAGPVEQRPPDQLIILPTILAPKE